MSRLDSKYKLVYKVYYAPYVKFFKKFPEEKIKAVRVEKKKFFYKNV